MKIWIQVIFLSALPLVCLAQVEPPTNTSGIKNVTTLKEKLAGVIDDSTRIETMQRIGFFYERLDDDSALRYYNEALALCRQKSYGRGESRILATMSGLMEHQGKFAQAFDLLFKALSIAEENHSAYDIARANRRISGVYFQLENYPKAVAYLLNALQMDEANHYPDKVAIDHYSLGDAYEKMNALDSATYHNNLALKQKELLPGFMQYVYQIDGHIQLKKGNYERATTSFKEGFRIAQQSLDLIGSSQLCADMSALFMRLHARDSAIFYALKGYNYGKEISFKKGIMLNSNLLADLYDSTQPSVALRYYKIAAAAKDSLFGVNAIQTIQDLIAREETRQKQLKETETAYREKLRLYGLTTGLAAMGVIVFILYRNNRQKQKANFLLQQQKRKVESSLTALKSAQAQLIQSEKMASLGELTAGIAHEIQNPLNFVNNFSDVNTELIDELEAEAGKGNMDEVRAIAKDIKDNEQKINHHGKRADAIVKGMLQHSRAGTGLTEPTNINKLADEYLRLAYHGLRAKDKSFSVTLNTNYDNTIGDISIIPQDIGRVLLNLINNAFYAVDEKKKQGLNGYDPVVSVSTSRSPLPGRGVGGEVNIKVADNGDGIPQKILDKIFQPFFTTKPTGQGTGLGLSLAYDIIKAHGGELKVETKEGVGSVFIIELPSI